MNKIKRKELLKIETRLASVKDVISDIKGDIEYVLADEENTLDNMERFFGTDRYASMEEAIGDMGNAVSALEDAMDNIDSAIECIDNAQN